MNRRAFLGLCLATGVAPAYVRAASMMKMVRRESGLLTPAADSDPTGSAIESFVRKDLGGKIEEAIDAEVLRKIWIPTAEAMTVLPWTLDGRWPQEDIRIRAVEYALLKDGRLVPWQENAHPGGIEVPDLEVEVDLRC